MTAAKAFLLSATTALGLAACSAEPSSPPETRPDGASGNVAGPAPAAAPSAAAAQRWDLVSSGEGAALALMSDAGTATLRLFCPAGSGRLLVNVPSFKPVASEERLSFGSGGDVVALVADTGGDAQRGGVSGTGAVPNALPQLIGGPVSINYGYQNSGPHPAPPAPLARDFVTACTDGKPVPAPVAKASASACLMQGAERLDVRPLRAVGTEPFWGARIEGRCVTYSHPDDQQGTRVWTRYSPAPGGGTWSGALDGRRFELRTRAEPGCSDGMSDRRYPIGVELFVEGERRRGCAEPI